MRRVAGDPDRALCPPDPVAAPDAVDRHVLRGTRAKATSVPDFQVAHSYPFRGLLGILDAIAISVRRLVRQLEDDGWVQVRQRGSHRQFRHPTKSGTVTVAGKESADVPPGTLNSVLKQAGLKSQGPRKQEDEP